MKFLTSKQNTNILPREVGEHDQITPFMLHLLDMSPRIRLNLLGRHVDDDVMYEPTKEFVYLPYGLPRISHEIAHMVEMSSPRRWVMNDWGFPALSMCLKHMQRSPRFFFASLSREIRVFAINYVLTEARGKCPNRLDNCCWSESAEKHLPFGRFKDMNGVMEYNAALTEHVIKNWSLDKIEARWKTRIDYIHNWMETA